MSDATNSATTSATSDATMNAMLCPSTVQFTEILDKILMFKHNPIQCEELCKVFNLYLSDVEKVIKDLHHAVDIGSENGSISEDKIIELLSFILEHNIERLNFSWIPPVYYQGRGDRTNSDTIKPVDTSQLVLSDENGNSDLCFINKNQETIYFLEKQIARIEWFIECRKKCFIEFEHLQYNNQLALMLEFIKWMPNLYQLEDKLHEETSKKFPWVNCLNRAAPRVNFETLRMQTQDNLLYALEDE